MFSSTDVYFPPSNVRSMDEKEDSDMKMEVAMAALIAVLSISTASTAYFSHMENSSSTHNYHSSQSILVTANSLYLEANQAIIYDFNAFDDYYLASEAGNQSVADYYYSGLSQEAIDSLDRGTGPFDDQYFDEMYDYAVTTEEEGLTLSERAAEENTASDEYQLAVLISAVGLSLVGWAALMQARNLKLTFMGCSMLALLLSVLQALSVG